MTHTPTKNSETDGRLDLRVKSMSFPHGMVGNAYGIRRIYWDDATGLAVEFCAGGGFGKGVSEKAWVPTKETGNEYQ